MAEVLDYIGTCSTTVIEQNLVQAVVVLSGEETCSKEVIPSVDLGEYDEEEFNNDNFNT